MKAKYLKESAKEYGASLLRSMKWFIPASAGVIVLGALALEAADEESEEKDEVPVEEQTNDEASVKEEANEESTDKVEVGNENLFEFEKRIKVE